MGDEFQWPPTEDDKKLVTHFQNGVDQNGDYFNLLLLAFLIGFLVGVVAKWIYG
jgi:hypothetical protein